jgi:predicted  nucleic acid-binding Zn-ribbon protein
MADQETSIGEVLEFLKDHMVTREEFTDLKDHMVTKEEFSELDGKVNRLEGRIDDLRTEIRSSELRLMDAMDEKNARLKGDLTVMMRGEDKKLSSLIRLLEKKELLTSEEAGSLLALQPFPQM